MTPNPILGALLHAIGACSSALCYTPQKKTRAWSWQTYWLAQATVCWLLLPIGVALLTIPNLGKVFAAADPAVIWRTTLLGAIYGIGGTAFGIAIRYIGFSVTYAIAIGISCVLGTIAPPLLKGELAAIFDQPGAGWVGAGIAVAAMGILASGLAGWLKDRDLRHAATLPADFHLGKGLFFSVLSGVLSAVFGISLDAGKPIEALAVAEGAGMFKSNVVYIFSCGGAYLSTAGYCLYLHLRHRTLNEYVELPVGIERASLKVNLAMSVLTGFLWYGQFFFYGLGHTKLGEQFGFTSWAIHMAMLVFFSTMAGLVLKEWVGCRAGTKNALALAIFVLLLAVALLTYGNYIGSVTAAGH